MMKREKPTDIEDVGEAMQRVDALGQRVYEGIRAAGTLHVNTVSGGSLDEVQKSPTWDYRDSAMYRLKSVKHHLHLLIRLRTQVNHAINEGDLSKRLHQREQRSEYMRHWAEERSAVFDSLVFQVSSLFDYLGFLAFSIYGSKRGRQKLDWVKVAKAASDVKNNPLGKTQVGREIAKQNKDWVASLYDYRSELIHRRMDSGGWIRYDSLSDTPDKRSEHFIYAPERFVSRFNELGQEQTTILFAAFWMVERAFATADSIVMSLNGDLMEETKKTPVVQPGNTYIRVIHPDLIDQAKRHGT